MLRQRILFCLLLSLVIWLPPIAGLSAQEERSSAARPRRADRYVLGVGDVIRVSVWKSPELGVTVPVRPDGKITVPLIGELDVVGLTPLEVQELLTTGFQDFVTAPAVSVVIEQINSLKIYIIGEVGSPGVYDIFQPTNLMQALAMAGGFTEYAKKDNVIVLQFKDDRQIRRVVNVKSIITGKDIAENVLLEPGDTIVVP